LLAGLGPWRMKVDDGEGGGRERGDGGLERLLVGDVLYGGHDGVVCSRECGICK
jgi:hypothetical protein